MEVQKKAEEKRAEQLRQARAQREADEQRQRAGYYKVGELYHKGNIKGIVFSIDDTGQHGMVLKVSNKRVSWDSANNGHLMSSDQARTIHGLKKKLNQFLKAFKLDPIDGSYWLSESNRGIVWYCDMDNEEEIKIRNCTKTDVRSDPYTKQVIEVYRY